MEERQLDFTFKTRANHGRINMRRYNGAIGNAAQLVRRSRPVCINGRSELVPNRSEEKMGKRGGFFSNPLSRRGDNPATIPGSFRTASGCFRPMQKIQCIIQRRKLSKEENSIHIQEGERGRSSARRHRQLSDLRDLVLIRSRSGCRAGPAGHAGEGAQPRPARHRHGLHRGARNRCTRSRDRRRGRRDSHRLPRTTAPWE